MKLSKTNVFVAVLIIMLGGVVLAYSLGLFSVESKKEAALIKTGEFAGQADPNDIRGSYSFADIEKNFGISPALLAKAFGIDAAAVDILAYQCKELEDKYAAAPEEIGTSSVRLFVAFMIGRPVELGPFLPETAVRVLMENADGLTADRKQYLLEHTVVIGQSAEGAGVKASQAEAPPPVEEPDGAIPKNTEVSPANVSEAATVEEPSVGQGGASSPTVEHTQEKAVGEVKGNTTIFDLMSWGVRREDIGPAIGVELPSDNGAKLRDLVIAAGKSFEDAKVILQNLVDKAK